MSGFVHVAGLTVASECLCQLGGLQATITGTLFGDFFLLPIPILLCVFLYKWELECYIYTCPTFLHFSNFIWMLPMSFL